MSEKRIFEDEGVKYWEAKGNSFEVAVEHAAEAALYDEDAGIRVGDELVVAATIVVIGSGSHISDYIVRLKQPGT